jgi:Uma2 family endonuclease
VTTTAWRATEADLLRTPDDGFKHELVDGEIRTSPAGTRHGLMSLKLASRLLAYARTGFRMPGGNVRCPDVAFVARGRFEGDKVPEGFSPVPPDLAVEVVSPDDRPRYVLDKIGEYLGAGVRLVWVVDAAGRVATVYRSLTDVRRLEQHEFLEGENVVPGFRCPLVDVLVP